MNIFSKRLQICVLLLLLLGLSRSIRIISSLAQTRTTSPQAQGFLPWEVKKVGAKRLDIKARQPDLLPAQRIIEDQIPKHLPIKVELKNLELEPLLRNVEVKVTNTSSKPIYYLSMSLMLPDVLSSDAYPIGFPSKYGRIDLISFREPLRPEDAPIRPGESYVFRIPETYLKGFDIHASRIKLQQSEIRRVYLLFHLLNFGDQTGFAGTGGTSIPNKHIGQISKSSAGETREASPHRNRKPLPRMASLL